MLQRFPVAKKWNEEKQKWEKVPAIPKGASWKDYSASPAEFAKTPNAGIVIPQGVILIDIDSYKGADRSAVESVLETPLDWEAAHLQTTVSGGAHFAFKVPCDVVLSQGSNLLGVEGFDTRAAGIGWICTGDGYTDETLMGIVPTLEQRDLPELPAVAIDKLLSGQTWRTGGASDVDLSLDFAVNHAKVEGVTLEDAARYLALVPKDALESHDPWLSVGMALHHQFNGDVEALRLWVEWSKGSSFYDKKECITRWRSFGNRDHISKPKTFKTLITMAGGVLKSSAAAPSLAEGLLAEAEGVVDVESYAAFKDKVSGISRHDLPDDLRALIVEVLTKGPMKGAGKVNIRKALQPRRKTGTAQTLGSMRAPEWLKGWVYVEGPCLFYHLDTGVSIKREAFNAKYDRMPECMGGFDDDCAPASVVALIKVAIPTYYNTLYWPAADRVLDYKGVEYVNTWSDCGVEPWDELGERGQGIVDRFVGHINNLLDGGVESEILLNFIAYAYQNRGKKYRWAPFIQGVEGCGKSFIANVLQRLYGENLGYVEASQIAGRFNGWAYGREFNIIEEMRISGQNKWEVADKTKPLLSNDTVPVEEKGRDARTVPNFTNYMFFSNHKDAVPITANDRRYCVMFSRFQTKEDLLTFHGGQGGLDAYFDALFDDLNDEGAGAVARFLLDYEVPESFKAMGRAPWTPSKGRMLALVESTDEYLFRTMLAEHACPIINDEIVDLTELNRLARRLSEMPDADIPPNKTQVAILREMGFEPIESKRVWVGDSYHFVWAKPAIGGDAAAKTVKAFHTKGGATDEF